MEMQYDLELDKVISNIKKSKAKRVCINLAEGLKPMADKIKREIESKTNAEAFIWADSCFGACDIPLEIEKLGIELLIQFGHNEMV